MAEPIPRIIADATMVGLLSAPVRTKTTFAWNTDRHVLLAIRIGMMTSRRHGTTLNLHGCYQRGHLHVASVGSHILNSDLRVVNLVIKDSQVTVVIATEEIAAHFTLRRRVSFSYHCVNIESEIVKETFVTYN